MQNFASYFLDIIFPQTCILCGKISENNICNICKKRLKKYEKQVLFSNSLKIEKFLHCGKVYFEKFFYLYEYKGLIRKIILDYKFNSKSYFCNFFVKMLLNCKKTYRLFSFYDIIIPVPMEKKKEFKRGYNQAKLITDILCNNLSLISGNSVVLKIKNTKTQSTLNLIDRKENIKNAFLVKNTLQVKNKNIIIFDDICTTGSTANELARVLKEAGAKEILVLVIAKD